MPVHGGPASGKTHPFAASRQASSTASPTARWSAWLTGPSSPQVRSKLIVMITSGWSLRNAAARSRRSGIPYSTSPSGWSRNSTVVTPTTAALRFSSSTRSGPT